MSRLSNIFVIHSKWLISTTLHEHGTESQSDVFSHCKDRPYSRTLQLFSPLFGSVIATRWPNRDNPCHPLQNLSPRYQESSKKSPFHKKSLEKCHSNLSTKSTLSTINFINYIYFPHIFFAIESFIRDKLCEPVA